MKKCTFKFLTIHWKNIDWSSNRMLNYADSNIYHIPNFLLE